MKDEQRRARASLQTDANAKPRVVPSERAAELASFHRSCRMPVVPDAQCWVCHARTDSRHRRMSGNCRPWPGLYFPVQVARLVELQRASVSHTLTRIQSPDRTTQDAGEDGERPQFCGQLKVDASAGSQRPIGLYEHAPCTDVENLHAVARPQRRSRRFANGPFDSHVGAAID